MNSLWRLRVACVASCASLLPMWFAAPLRAQAVVPDRGEATLTITYQNYDVIGHYDAQGHTNGNGSTRSQALVTEFDYGVMDRFGLLVTLPFIASKYTGAPSYFVGPYLTRAGPLDDGAYHGAFQDVRIELRRQWSVGPVPVTPFIGASFPTHDYETVGEAVPGRHRRDLQFGANTAIDLDRILRGAYVDGRYTYAAMQRVNDFPFTRSIIDLDAGAAVTSRVLLRALAEWQIRHSGPSLAELYPDWINHDRFIAPSYTHVGGGASLSMTRTTELFALFVGTVAGSNGAHRQRTLALGVSVSLGSGLHGLGGGTGSAHPAGHSSLIEPFR